MTTVSALMTRGGQTIRADISVREAIRRMADLDISHLLVTGDSGRLLGVVCMCDLEWANIDEPLRQHMVTHPLTVEIDSTASAAAALMSSSQVSCLPVVRAGDLLGVITLHDLRRHGFSDPETERCSACGGQDHVRHGLHGSELPLCLECAQKSRPADADEELGGED